jgi:hypothetical protein
MAAVSGLIGSASHVCRRINFGSEVLHNGRQTVSGEANRTFAEDRKKSEKSAKNNARLESS